MTKSLPAIPDVHPGARRARTRLIERLHSIAASVGPKVMPWIPSGAKWALAGGRSVTIDGNTLDRTLQTMLSGMRSMGADGLVVDDNPTVSRALMRQMCLALPGPQIHVAVTDMSIPGPAGELKARHYRPSGEEPAPLLLFFHGGGFALGDLDMDDALCRLTCRDAGIHVLSIDYRLAPEHPAPAAIDDAYTAFQWAHEHAAELGAIPGRVAVGGESAGGNLAAVVSQLARDKARNGGGPTPVLQWLIYPMTDLSAQTRSRCLFAEGFLLTKYDIDWFHAQYLEGSGIEPTDPRVSPLRADTLSGLPPALIAIAGFDPLHDEGVRYAAALQAAGTDVDLRSMGSLAHGFATLFPLGGGSATATRELVSALRAHMSRV